MPRNRFRSLQGRLFRHTPNLRWLRFHNNPSLINVGFNIFGWLPYLREVNFGGIGCGQDQELNSTDTSIFSRIASRLMLACPPDEDDLADDLDGMECNFDPDKSSRSKRNSREANLDD